MADVEVEVRIVRGSFTTVTLFALYCEKWTLTMLRLGVSEVKQADEPMKYRVSALATVRPLVYVWKRLSFSVQPHGSRHLRALVRIPKATLGPFRTNVISIGGRGE